MGRICSVDLRERVVALVLSGATVREAAAHYNVSVASAVRWSQRARSGRGLVPGKRGGHRPSPLCGEVAEWILARIDEKPDLSLRALTAELVGRGVMVHVRSVWRFMRRAGMSFKKNAVGQRAGWVKDRPASGALAQAPTPP